MSGDKNSKKKRDKRDYNQIMQVATGIQVGR